MESTLPPFETEKMGAVIHAPPFETKRNGGGIHAAPTENKKKWGRRVGFTPPPSLTPANMLEMERRVGTTPLHCRRCWRRIPPQREGIIELERGGVWFSHRLVGFWNVQTGGRGHERPPPTPGVSPAPSFPIPPAFSLCSIRLAPPHSHSSISAPTSLEGRGDRSAVFTCDVASGCRQRWRVAVVGGGEVACGGRQQV